MGTCCGQEPALKRARPESAVELEPDLSLVVLHGLPVPKDTGFSWAAGGADSADTNVGSVAEVLQEADQRSEPTGSSLPLGWIQTLPGRCCLFCSLASPRWGSPSTTGSLSRIVYVTKDRFLHFLKGGESPGLVSYPQREGQMWNTDLQRC